MKEENKPKYPLCIISKGRHDTNFTHRSLLDMGQDHRVVIEPHEYDLYAASIEEKYLLVLPWSNHGQGSTPARNWCWQWAKRRGHKRVWIIDDNILLWMRFHNESRLRVKTPAIFRAMEDFSDRYKNVMVSGPNYVMFMMEQQKRPAYTTHTRIFSCCLCNTDFEYSWAGRYNEDVILSLNAAIAGNCNLQFNSFLQHKMQTQTMKGGNSQELYGDGTDAKSQFLKEVFPEHVELIERFGRPHHFVNYDKFRGNKLIPVDNLPLSTEPNEYGMVLLKDTGGAYEHITEFNEFSFREQP